VRLTLSLLIAMLVCNTAGARETQLAWRFMDPAAAEAFASLRQNDGYLSLNLDPDDEQGRDRVDRRSLNFNATDLDFALLDANGDGRAEAFLLPLGPGSSGSTARAAGFVMVEDARGHWRMACDLTELLWNNGRGVGVFLGGATGRGWRPFRTLEGPYDWRRMDDGSGRMECVSVAGPIRGRAVRRGERLVRWQRSIDPIAADALRAFRQANHPIANAMAINHEGARIGIDRRPGRPRNFDPAFDLLYATSDLGRRGAEIAFLLFDWPMLRREGEPLPGVVMWWSEPEARWRIACTIADAGDRGAAGGVTLLDARSEGMRDFRTSAGRYAWVGGPAGPACRAVGP
jgi:hypothetical protein